MRICVRFIQKKVQQLVFPLVKEQIWPLFLNHNAQFCPESSTPTTGKLMFKRFLERIIIIENSTFLLFNRWTLLKRTGENIFSH